jgi:diguanylate cyclase (GGDEF)-like protein
MLLVPAAFALTAIGLLIYDHFSPLHPVALVLTVLTLLAALLRTSLTFRDVRALAETRRQATTDDLTSLPNRRRFMEEVQAGIAAARATSAGAALLLIDLDQFKELNDTLGHRAGDLLLRQIGPRLAPVLRSGDMLARLGGDEFGLLLEHPCDEATAVAVAARVSEALRAPFDVEGLHLSVGASAGIAMFPEHAQDAEGLLQRADVAMYQAKAGQTDHEVYARERDRHSRDNLTLAGQLPGAIEAGELEVHFQPKAEADSRRVVAAEALVRWRHPERGLLAPGLFLPLAEQLGLGRDVTRAVMVQALDCCSAWRAAGHDLQVSVNVSVADLLDVEFPLEVAAALATHGLPADALMIEVTESSVMTDPGRIGEVLRALRALGTGVSLDDFGTGYSSLTHLRTLPVCEVKLDRSFVSRMGSDAADAAIVRSTIELAHTLGMEVVAEGVEDDATWEHLVRLGCELVQGFRLSPPLDARRLAEFLEQSRMAVVA